MPPRLPLTTLLRRSRFALRLAMGLMLLQALSMAVHWGALAAAASGGSPGAMWGILNVCSPLPVFLARADGSAPAQPGGASCPVCSMANASGSAICVETPPALLPAWIMAAAPAQPGEDITPSSATSRYGSVRGPPLPFIA